MARRLRTVFFGSSTFSLPSLSGLRKEHDVLAVVTQPAKPAGRGMKLTPTPVEAAANAEHIPVLTPARLDAEFLETLRTLRPELLACASYGKIVPAAVLESAELAALNVHPSLLPRYRGATPIQSALRDGAATSGVTVFWMTARMDAGDIALARETPITPSDDYGSLHDKLASQGGELVREAAALLAQGRLPRTPQREEEATYCRPLQKEDLRLCFDAPAQAVVDQVRSLSPKPGAWMPFQGKRLKVLQAQAVASGDGASPGTVLAADAEGPIIACRTGAVRLLRVVPEGKAAMSGAQFARQR